MKRRYAAGICPALFLCALAACELPVNPDAAGAAEGLDRLGPTASLGPSGFNVYNFQLRPSGGSSSVAWGHIQLRIGTRLPPNPCSDPLTELPKGAPRVALCGTIHNPAEETFTAGDLSAGRAADVFVPFALAVPPNPCRTVRFAGVLELTQAELDALVADGSDPGAKFLSTENPGGALAGSTATTPPPPDGGNEKNPGPLSEPVCSAEVTPQAR